jgi:hypothetical protein
MISSIEIDEYAAMADFARQVFATRKLLEQGWLGEQARYDDPKCDGQTFCAGNHAVFPR